MGRNASLPIRSPRNTKTLTMKLTNLKLLAAACLAFGLGTAIAGETPKGWFPAGSHPKDYEMSVDPKVTHAGKASASIKCIATKPEGFGTLMQSFLPDTYRGKRVRMSGFVRSADVSSWAGLWMRVDGPGKTEPLAFDNMQDRPIRATTDWTKYEVILDVPEQAQGIAFGVLLDGAGQVWFDDFKLEIVEKDVPTTRIKAPPAPKNLDFEE